MTLIRSQTGPGTTLRDLILLTILLGTLFGIMLGSRPLSVPDEGRYVEIPREMVTTGDYLTPRLNGVKYFEKPVLFYWLESVSIRFFGLGEFGLRLWPALFALAGCLAVYAAGKKLYDRRAGLLSAIVLATNLLYYGLSRAIILDMPVTVLLSLSLLSFLAGSREPAGGKRRFFFWAFYSFAALAVLTKGLIGMVIPGMIIGAWIVLLGEWRLIKEMYLPSGFALFLLIAAPWHILVQRANPEFFNFYFIHEHVLRYLTKIHSRYQPGWFFIPVILLGLFPWTSFLIQAVRFSLPGSWRSRREHRDGLFLILWAGLVFLFFSASDSKLVPYILPVFPPLALLIGRYLAAAWNNPDMPGLRTGIAVLAVTGLALAAAFFALPSLRTDPEVLRLGGFRPALGVILALLGAGVWILLARRGIRAAIPVAALGAVLFLITLNAAADRIDTQSIKPLAQTLKPRLNRGDLVACFNTYYQDLPVYLERRVNVVNWMGELEFGMSVEDTRTWMMDNASFWKQWNGPGTAYMFTKRSTYEIMKRVGVKSVYLLAGTNETVLLTNKETSS